MKERLSDVAVSEAEVQLLWKCFHFHAYHPFPRNVIDGKVDFSAFQRAIALLVVQGNETLSGCEGVTYWIWHHHFLNTSFERILRSISLPEETDGPSVHFSQDSMDEAMWVLRALTKPLMADAHGFPDPDLLRPTARKLVGENGVERRCLIARKDLSILLSLLLRLKLGEARWGGRFHVGTIEKRDLDDEVLVDVLAKGLGVNQDEEYLTSGHIGIAMDLLVSQTIVEPGSSKCHAGNCTLRQFDDLTTSFCSWDHQTTFDKGSWKLFDTWTDLLIAKHDAAVIPTLGRSFSI